MSKPPIPTRNPQALIRDWCAATRYPLTDLNGRARIVREKKMLTAGAHGINAPMATMQDAGVLVLATLVAALWKDVPAGILRYGALVGDLLNINDAFKKRFGKETCRQLDAFEGKILLEAVMRVLASCPSWTDMRVLSLRVERSDYEPMAWLTLGAPPAEAVIRFVEPGTPREGVEPEPRPDSARLRGFALHAMADLIADNIRAAEAAAQAAAEATQENGPPVSPDEPPPESSDESSRAGKPAPPLWYSEAMSRLIKYQLETDFEAHGDPSGTLDLSHLNWGDPPPRKSPKDPPDESHLDVDHHPGRDAGYGPPVAGDDRDRRTRPGRSE
jgi:hypothetical protein